MAYHEIIDVDFDGRPYQIHIGRNVVGNLSDLIAEKTNNRKIMLVADSFFEPSLVKEISSQLVGNGYEVFIHLMDAGKGNKNMNEVLKIFAVLEENDLARDSTLIAIGGGVVGDLAGFVASTWLRGMNLVHIPTTLMAMVDSSVGGKVAINFRRTINAIGNYYHPMLTLMDLNLVDTLSERDYKSGLAEVIKCAIISDKEFYNYLDKHQVAILERQEQELVYFIAKTIKIKIQHVQGDVREGSKRLLLNYGHTLGHSVEISTEKHHQEQYRHGEGVSIGIMAVAYIAINYLKLPQMIYDSFEQMFQAYGLPTCIDSKALGFEKDALLKKCIRNVQKDKKRINNKLRLILADEIGKATVYADVPFAYIEEAFEHIIN
jgi:3-dehydroquinate synthase